MTLSPLPDKLVGGLICAVFFRSAFLVAREARAELRRHGRTEPVLFHVDL
jgi:hypothetical protein